MAISMLKIRRPLGRLIFNMGIAIPGKTVFLIETAPCFQFFIIVKATFYVLQVVKAIPSHVIYCGCKISDLLVQDSFLP